MLSQKTKPVRHLGSYIFVAVAILLLVAGVVFIMMACRSYFRYQRFGRALEYTFGSTSEVVVTMEDGSRMRLSDNNRFVLYSMMVDSSGTRHETGGQTGESFSFYATSAVGDSTGTIAEAGDDWVYIQVEYEDEEWKYYLKNRSTFDEYLKVVSQEGWIDENTPLGKGQA